MPKRRKRRRRRLPVESDEDQDRDDHDADHDVPHGPQVGRHVVTESCKPSALHPARPSSIALPSLLFLQLSVISHSFSQRCLNRPRARAKAKNRSSISQHHWRYQRRVWPARHLFMFCVCFRLRNPNGGNLRSSAMTEVGIRRRRKAREMTCWGEARSLERNGRE